MPGAGAAEAITTKGASALYLPAYSPDCNPIEKFFLPLKSILQRIAARAVDALRAAAKETLQSVTTDQCRNDFPASSPDAV